MDCSFERLKIHAEIERFWNAVDSLSNSSERKFAVREWLNFIGAKRDLQGADKWIRATRLQAEAFLQWNFEQNGRKGTPRANSTISARLGRLKAVCKQLQGMGFLPENIFDSIPLPDPRRNQKCKAPNFTRAEVRKLMRSFDVTKEKDKRNRAIFALLFGGGLRVSEVAKLNIDNVRRTEQGTVYVKIRASKAGPDQTQTIVPDFAPFIVSHAQERRRQEFVKKGAPLFSKRIFTQERLSLEAYRKICERQFDKIGLEGSTHSGRRTMINALLDSGVAIQDVQLAARHAVITSTTHYQRERDAIEESPLKLLHY